MASFGQSYVADELPQSTNNADPIPDGWYNAVIHSADIKPTKDGTGQYISMRYDVTGPKYQGRVVFSNLNIKNKSSQAEEIGRQQLGALMRAIGLARVDDTDQLVGANLQIKVSTRQSEGYDPQNEVRGFKPIGGESSTPMPTQQQNTQPSNAKTPPWKK